GPQCVVGVLGKDQMVRREAGADQSEPAGRRVVHRQMAIGLTLERERLGRWMVRSLPAEIGIGRWTNPRRDPDPPLLVHHRVVRPGLAVPDRRLSPVWG